MKSTMSHRFAITPDIEIPRSQFDRAHGYKTTFDVDYLIPFFSDEVLPGDTFSLQMAHLVRLATPIFPIMDNLHLDTFFFFVPNRLLWDNWERFNGAQDKPDDSTDYLIPTITAPEGGFAVGSPYDYLGIPTGVEGIEINALYFRALNLIYNEWFRDQNLIDSLPVPTGDGPDSPSLYTLQRRGKRHDYFTSALPFPQKGPGVEIPIAGNQAPVYGNGTLGLTDGRYNVGLSATGLKSGNKGLIFGFQTDSDTTIDGGAGITYGYGKPIGTSLGSNYAYSIDSYGYRTVGVVPSGDSGLYADLTQAGAATINDIRQAFAVQRLYERDARGGTRYVEILKSHFGVTSPDFRLQRPEFLGGTSSRINVTPVVNQTGTQDRAQGDLAAFGLSTGSDHGFTASFTEHGVIIGFCNIWADLTYQQGVERRFSRRDRLDYYLPVLSHLGEQAILNKEIYATGTDSDNDVFGYQERYGEYRYKNSLITGKMRSSDPQSLDAWHLSQDFTALPTLSKDFIECNTPLDRCIAVQDEPHFIGDFYFSLKCTRPMPLYGVPGMLDHF